LKSGNYLLTLYYKVLFMIEQNQHLEALKDIRKMMQRSSRFISLSGLSGIAAGVWALVGSYFAYDWITEFHNNHLVRDVQTQSDVIIADPKHVYGSFPEWDTLKINLILLAGAILALSVLSALYFTWRRAGKNKVPLWDHTSRQLILNTAIPIIAGGLFILAMLQRTEWRYVAPASLVFYGLALVNGSKYTVSDIRYLGFLEIILGLINTQYIGYGIYFWAMGFGVLHIIYGFMMWWKYERKPAVEE
jgi:hypothetical protein